jgi:DNA-directed RNA polymerase specialized sigma24 family protein
MNPKVIDSDVLSTTIREPILGLRKPIVGIRKAITGRIQRLNWDDLIEEFDAYIKFAARQVSSTANNKVVFSQEDLYQEALMLLYKQYEEYNTKPMNEFKFIYKASMWRLLRNLAFKTEVTQIDLDEAYDLGYDEDTWSQMYEEYKLKQVIELLGGNQVALNILREMLAPSYSTVHQAEMDIARKETIKAQGYSINIPHTIDVKGDFIRRTLGITQKMYKQNLKILQRCVYQIYSQDREIKKYEPSDLTKSHNFVENAEESQDLVGKIKVAIDTLIEDKVTA